MLSNAKQIFLTIVAAVVFATAASPQSPVPIEEEFQVNTYTTSYQTDPDLAATSDGDFVVVWNDYSGQDGDPAGIFAQRFDAAGTALGGELQVNAYPTGSQTVPAVTFGTDGGFVVLWMGPGEEDSFGVFGQRFDSAGDESGVNFHVNTYTTGLQGYPSVAPAGDGFLVVWESDQDGDDRGIFAQRFDSDGTHLADEFQVNTTTASGQTNPHVASLAQGDFVVVWTDYGAADGDLRGVFAQRLDSAGGHLGGEFQVNTTTTGDQYNQKVAADAVGGFVVVWTDSGLDGSLSGVFGQRFDSAGTIVDTEFQINTTTAFSQHIPAVTSTTAGDFVVAWRSPFQDGSSHGVFGQRFDSGGAFSGEEFQINTYTTDSQGVPSLAAGPTGELIVIWVSEGQDGDLSGVFGQRFALPIFTDGFESGNTSAWSSAIP